VWTVLPIVDISPLLAPGGVAAPDDDHARAAAAAAIGAACEGPGVFLVTGHGVSAELRAELFAVAHEFFSLPGARKAEIAMSRGGRAWRGWFGVGGELTAGVPDDKEGLYLGAELSADHPAVLAGRPMHGPNLWPSYPPRLRPVVEAWMGEVAAVGQAVLSGMATALGLAPGWFDRWCAEPTVLFRMFHSPPRPADLPASWAVGEHTDYGLLTLLAQDDVGGLEVRSGDDWVPVDPVPDTFVCNLGDMVELATGGRYRSTPHRVLLPSTDRYSFPLFLDPGWDAVIEPLPGVDPSDLERAARTSGRWDGLDLFAERRPYGEYLMAKVSQVFPDLFAEVMGDR
jgi:isopenicillin N synthase-like dioxygenase